MRYINTWEQRGIDKGMQQGMERGLEKGLALGQAALLERQLTRRFGPLTAEASSRLVAATPEQLRDWGDRVLDAASLDEVFGGH